MNTEKAKGKIEASLDEEPRGAIYTAIHDDGTVDIVMAGSEGDDRATAAVDLVGAQIRYFSDAFDCHEDGFAYDATSRAVENRGIEADEEVHIG